MTAAVNETAGDSGPGGIGPAAEALKRAILEKILYVQGKFPRFATRNDHYMGLAYAVRDRLLERWANTLEAYLAREVKVACHLSAEFQWARSSATTSSTRGSPTRRAQR